MVKTVNSKIGSLVLGTLALMVPSNASAGEITLTFEKHDLTVSGEFAGFEENAYIIKTENGDLHVPIEMVTCEGTNCFEFAQADRAEG